MKINEATPERAIQALREIAENDQLTTEQKAISTFEVIVKMVTRAVAESDPDKAREVNLQLISILNRVERALTPPDFPSPYVSQSERVIPKSLNDHLEGIQRVRDLYEEMQNESTPERELTLLDVLPKLTDREVEAFQESLNLLAERKKDNENE